MLAAVGPEPALVVATPGAEPVAEGGYSAVLLLDAWASLDLPVLDAPLESLRRWAAAAALVRPGRAVVLCGAPEGVVLPAIEALVRWDPAWLAERELAERRELDLPPAVRMAQLTGPRRGLEEALGQLELPPGAQLLGPMPITAPRRPAGEGGPVVDRHALVRIGLDDSAALTRALAAMRAVRSARKETEVVAVRVDPHGVLLTGGGRVTAMPRDLDIVLLGASGFVGALTAAHLAEHAPEGVRIALAGRSRSRLEAVQDDLGRGAAAWELVEVDATDAAGLRALAARTVVLATTVGPYAVHGREVVRACAEEGTHYADLTGEVLFVRWALDHVADRARETGAKIVHACGFDSIPSDLGVLVDRGPGRVRRRRRARRDDALGPLDEGWLLRGHHRLAPPAGDPGALGCRGPAHDGRPLRPEPAPHGGAVVLGRPPPGRGPRPGPARRVGPARRRHRPLERPLRHGRLQHPDRAAVQHAHRLVLRPEPALPRGRRLRCACGLPVMAVGTGLGLRALLTSMAFAPARVVVDRFLPKPGEGPSAEQRAAGRFRMEIRATTTTGGRYLTKVGADHDPGYEGTAVMFGQAALCLALDGDRLPDRSGVLTPSTAMGEVLVDRLRARDFTFDCERLDD